VTHGLPSWHAPSQAFALVASLRLGLQQFVDVSLYRIIHNNLPKISQDTIVTLRKTMYMVKATHLEKGIK
jgi:hypothetical protein